MPDLKLIRVDSNHKDFRSLVKLLDQELAVFDGEDHAFYDQFNQLDSIKHALVLYSKSEAVSCGAFKKYDDSGVEIKRMYTKLSARNKGFARMILAGLESWAKELSYTYCLLETGLRQEAAIQMYINCAYNQIPNYGQYQGIENSVCFKKLL